MQPWSAETGAGGVTSWTPQARTVVWCHGARICKVGQTGVRRSAGLGFGGIDVAKAQWEIALCPSGERGAVPNAPNGCLTLVERLQAVHPTLMVLEAPGGLACAATAALAPADLPVVVGNPRQDREVARDPRPLATPPPCGAMC